VKIYYVTLDIERNYVTVTLRISLAGGPDHSTERALWGNTLAYPNLPVVDILNVIARGQRRYGLCL